MNARYLDGSALADELIPGMVVWIMFAGFHTSSNTASWTAVELARNPQLRARDRARDRRGVPARRRPLVRGPARAARARPLHRRGAAAAPAARDADAPGDARLRVQGQRLPARHRARDLALRLAPRARGVPRPRALRSRRARRPESVFGSIPFGGGRRKCVGNAFALLQVQSIFCALLARYEFEPVDPPETLPRRDAVADPAPERAVPAALPPTPEC